MNSNEQHDPDAQGSAGRIRHLADVFVRRLGWIVLTTCVFVGIAAGYVLERKRSYVAVTQILFDAPALKQTDGAEAPAAGLNQNRTGFLEAQSLLILSDPVLRPVVDREGLVLDDEFNGKDTNLVDRLRLMMATLLPASRAAGNRENHALDALRRASRTSPSGEGLVVDLEVGTSDREKSARLANAIANSYMVEEIESRSGPADRVSISSTM